jgi:hypothetical protein
LDLRVTINLVAAQEPPARGSTTLGASSAGVAIKYLKAENTREANLRGHRVQAPVTLQTVNPKIYRSFGAADLDLLSAKRSQAVVLLPEHDPDHGDRAGSDRHRADQLPILKRSDNGCPPDKGSLRMRQAPSRYTHPETPFGPQQQRFDSINAKLAGYSQFGCNH